MSSELQQDASRSNGAKSHGALSPETQAICAQNSRKHGLTAKTIVVGEDERDDYDKIVSATFRYYRPITDMEKLVIQSVADLEWKLHKADIYESGLLAFTRATCKEDLMDVDASERYAVIEGIVYQTNAKLLQNLTLQRSRTQRDLEKRVKHFEAMRAEREVVEVAQRNMAVESTKTTNPHPSVGSVFSTDYLIARMQFEKEAEKEGKKGLNLKLAIFDRRWGANPSISAPKTMRNRL